MFKHHGFALVGLAGVLGWAGSVRATDPFLMFGRPGDLAADQLRVTFAFEDPADPGEIVGPQIFNTGLLDTGANGVLLGEQAYYDEETLQVNPALYERERRPNNALVVYNESGVAGSEPFDVTIPYNLYVAGDDGIPISEPLVRALGSSTIDLPIAGVVGMPAMTGRVVTADFRGLPNLQQFTVVDFVSTPPPPVTPISYEIPLTMLEPEYTGQDPDFPNDPLPTFHDLPLIENLGFSHGAHHTSQTLLLDTGAQNSIISRSAAIELGIDPDDPNHEYIEVGGIGGSTLMPLVLIDEMTVPTTAGVDLVFHDVVVGILDITGIDGVIGMNLQTTGYFDLLFDAEEGEYGAFEYMVLDFRDPNLGKMRLDVNPAYVLSPGDADGDHDVDVDDLASLAANYGMDENAYWKKGDFDRDGDVDLVDLTMLATHYSAGQAQAMADFESLISVPEPSGPLLAALGLLGLARRIRKRLA